MKTKKMRYVWFLAILCIFCLTLFLARTRSKVDMRNRIYRQWQDHFVSLKEKSPMFKQTIPRIRQWFYQKRRVMEW